MKIKIIRKNRENIEYTENTVKNTFSLFMINNNEVSNIVTTLNLSRKQIQRHFNKNWSELGKVFKINSLKPRQTNEFSKPIKTK